jgi:cardiolipin synthase
MGNFRTHRKIVVIDGRIGYSGGMNVTDVHTAEFSGDAAWRDTHIRLVGPAVRGLQMVFCEGWHDVRREPLEGAEYFPDPASMEPGDHTIQIVSSGPDENRNAIHKLFVSAMSGAENTVYLTSPYFVPDGTTFNALATAALRGADVRVLVPKDNDLKLVGAASRSYYPELLEVGVRVFEFGPPMLHAKTLVVDDVVAVVGTANADARSFRLNFEVVVANYDGALCSQLAAAFKKDLEDATEVTAETLASYGVGRRLGQNFARLLSPIL